MSAVFANYKRLSVEFVSGQGCYLRDAQGREYLDFLSGIAVSCLGHAHPRLVKAIQDQAARLLHVSNLYRIPLQEKLATELARVTGQEKVFFCNSGGEANEGVIKLARRFAHAHNLPPTIVVTHNSFHGRTLATVSATGNPKYQEGFAPLVPGFRFVDYNDLEAARRALEEACAVLVEPIQGEGGVVPAEAAYLQGLQSHCRDTGRLFMVDEVQTGMGRTGHWLACSHFGVAPDVVSMAKGLGGGLPIGAVLTSDTLSQHLGPGTHGSTFGGNPLVCAGALEVLRAIEEEGLLENAQEMGRLLADRLATLPGVDKVRGVGLMLAALTEEPASEVVERAFQEGLLLNAVRPNAIRITPPLVVGTDDIERACGILERCLN